VYTLARARRPSLLLILAVLACMVPGCTSSGARSRVMVLGIDGVDPGVVDLLMSQGKLPNFAKLRQGGAYAPLKSMKPLLSPVIWTTIATGKTPDQHRIGHFTAVNQVTGEQLPVTSHMRKTKAIWNIASDANDQVAVVGWWATWPAETVNGCVVTDHLCYHFLFEDGFEEKAKDPAGKTYPPELVGELARFVKRPGDLTREQTEKFVHVSDEEFDRPFSFQDDLGHFKWALATAMTYRDVGLYLWKEKDPDLMMVYFEGVDSTSHLFGHLFHAEGLAGELAEQKKKYGDAVEQMYIYADGILGDFMDAMDDGTTLFVMSDHGFQLGELPDDPSRTRDMRRVSERYHNSEGILYVYGNGVKPHSRLNEPSILDVTPTMLSVLGIPAAKDMPGRVLTEGLQGGEPEPRVATYETGEERGDEGPESDPEADEEMMAKLQSLGYLNTASPAGDRNLAAVLFEEGKYAEAADAYRKLVEKAPDDGGLRASLAGALGALGKYDEALVQLDKAIELQPLNPEAYHNRAVIHQRRGDDAAAIKDYQTALRYNPQYEPARTALRRMGAPDSAQPERTPAQQLAFKIAEQASQSARRGDYEDAMAKLDEAQRIAPRFALVFQYRANVAYLMGDKAAAVEALEKGLEIEPDNALFKENLRRLKQPGAP